MFPRKTIMVASFCLLLAFVVSEGKAQDPENLDLAVALVEADGSAFIFDGVAQSLVQQQTQLILSQHPKLDSAILERFKTVLMEELIKQKADLLHIVAGLYATHYAQGDLQGLIAFYESDLGKRTVEVGRQIQDDIFQVTSQWAITAIQRAGTRAHARLKEQGIEL